MSYVDAIFDRNEDLIRVVERHEGKRKFVEHPVKYIFYYKDSKGKHLSIYGDPLSKIICKNTNTSNCFKIECSPIASITSYPKFFNFIP